MGRQSKEVNKKVIVLKDLTSVLSPFKKGGKKIVFLIGAFDFLHIGHLIYLERAKEQGDILVVGVLNDKDIKRLKGKFRPIHRVKHRSRLLASLEPIDYVIVLPKMIEPGVQEYEPYEVIKPDIFCIPKGSGILKEAKEIIKKYGGKLTVLPYSGITSTSLIYKKLKGEEF